MKVFLNKYGMLFGLILSLVAVFAFGGIYSRYMTNQIEVHEEEVEAEKWNEFLLGMFDEATKVEAFTSVATDKTYSKPDGSESFTPSVDMSYKVFNGDQEIGVIYIITSHGNAADMQIAYAILLETDSIIHVEAIQHNETITVANQYYLKLDDIFFSQFDQLSFDSIALTIDAISGATFSSKGFEIGMNYAREAYAADYDFEIPVLVMELNSITYNLDPSTFAEATFIADITYGVDANQATVLLARDYSYISMVSGAVEPSDTEKDSLKLLASANTEVSNKSYFMSFDDSTRTLIMKSKGYEATPIQVTFVLNATLDGIDSYTVLSFESYADDYNNKYTGSPAPAVERAFLDAYVANQDVAVDTYAGASRFTKPAMEQMLLLLDEFILSLNGGSQNE